MLKTFENQWKHENNKHLNCENVKFHRLLSASVLS